MKKRKEKSHVITVIPSPIVVKMGGAKENLVMGAFKDSNDFFVNIILAQLNLFSKGCLPIVDREKVLALIYCTSMATNESGQAVDIMLPAKHHTKQIFAARSPDPLAPHAKKVIDCYLDEGPESAARMFNKLLAGKRAPIPTLEFSGSSISLLSLKKKIRAPPKEEINSPTCGRLEKKEANSPLVSLAHALWVVLTDPGTIKRVRRCPEPECGFYFFDYTRPGNKVYCQPKCQNRSNVRNYRRDKLGVKPRPQGLPQTSHAHKITKIVTT